jgi:hypothetical protein
MPCLGRAPAARPHPTAHASRQPRVLGRTPPGGTSRPRLPSPLPGRPNPFAASCLPPPGATPQCMLASPATAVPRLTMRADRISPRPAARAGHPTRPHLGRALPGRAPQPLGPPRPIACTGRPARPILAAAYPAQPRSAPTALRPAQQCLPAARPGPTQQRPALPGPSHWWPVPASTGSSSESRAPLCIKFFFLIKINEFMCHAKNTVDR